MRIFYIVLFFLFLISGCSLFNSQDSTKIQEAEVVDLSLSPQLLEKEEGVRKRVMVLPFLNLSHYPAYFVEKTAQRILSQTLIETGDVILIPSSDLSMDLEKFRLKGVYDLKKILPTMHKLGIHGIVVGRIHDIRTRKVGQNLGLVRKVLAQAKVVLEVEVYSGSRGRTLFKKVRSARNQEKWTRVAQDSRTDLKLRDKPALMTSVIKAALIPLGGLIVNSMEHLDWSARVALIRGQKVYLNAGRVSGLRLGDVLTVSEDRQEILDPDTGRSIGSISGHLKGTIEVINYFGKDGSVALIRSGSGFMENDLVEFY